MLSLGDGTCRYAVVHMEMWVHVADILLPPLSQGNLAVSLAQSYECVWLICSCGLAAWPPSILGTSWLSALLGRLSSETKRGSKSIIATEGKAAGEFVSE